MLLAGHLAKVQGLKGEFLLHAAMDEPERLPEVSGLRLTAPGAAPDAAAGREVRVRLFRWHQDRPCVAFEGILDRTAAEPFKGWALWMPEDQAKLGEGESFRHDWVGCEVFVGPRKVGEVLALLPSPGGYDMVHMRDLRPGRSGRREIPYIKAWWTLDLPNRKLQLDPPEGLLDLDRLGD